MSVHILDISAYYHDSVAALLTGVGIIAAANEKRFTRKKVTLDVLPMPYPLSGIDRFAEIRSRLCCFLRHAIGQIRTITGNLHGLYAKGILFIWCHNPRIAQG